MTIQEKMDSAQVYVDYVEFANDLIDYVDERFESVSVVADADTVLKVLTGITELVSPTFGYVGIENTLTKTMYRLTINEDYVVTIEPIGDAESGYLMDILDNYTYCSANVPLSVYKFLEREGIDFEVFDVAEDYDDYDGDCEDCEYAVPVDEDESENEAEYTYELRAEPGIELSELSEMAAIPNININVSGDAYINYYHDYKINCDD